MALEKYLQTDASLGLNTKDTDSIKRLFGENTFRPLKLTSIWTTI